MKVTEEKDAPQVLTKEQEHGLKTSKELFAMPINTAKTISILGKKGMKPFTVVRVPFGWLYNGVFVPQKDLQPQIVMTPDLPDVKALKKRVFYMGVTTAFSVGLAIGAVLLWLFA